MNASNKQARPAFEVPTFGSDLPLVPEDWKKFVSPGLLDKNSATKVLIVHTNAAGFGKFFKIMFVLIN